MYIYIYICIYIYVYTIYTIYFADSAWAYIRDSPFDSEFKSFENLRFVFFVLYQIPFYWI